MYVCECACECVHNILYCLILFIPYVCLEKEFNAICCQRAFVRVGVHTCMCANVCVFVSVCVCFVRVSLFSSVYMCMLPPN